MIEILTTVFVASLLGSLHCVGMCGGFVCMLSSQQGSCQSASRPLIGQVAYHGGRLSSYMLLGVLCGWIGSSVDEAASWAGYQRMAAVLAGVCMLLWGMHALLGQLFLRYPHLQAKIPLLEGRRKKSSSSKLTAWVASILRRFQDSSLMVRGLLMGSLSALLPCGWLYAFALCAAGTGDLWAGAAVMGAFWLGTVPLLLGVARVSTAFASKLPVITACSMLVIGALTVSSRWNLIGDLDLRSSQQNSQEVNVSKSLIEQIEEIGNEEPACCSGVKED